MSETTAKSPKHGVNIRKHLKSYTIKKNHKNRYRSDKKQVS